MDAVDRLPREYFPVNHRGTSAGTSGHEEKAAKREGQRRNGQKPGGKGPQPPPVEPPDKKQYNLKAGNGSHFEQAYNAQATVGTETLLIVGQLVTDAPMKEVIGFRRFSMRGKEKAETEWSLVCLSYNLNLKKMFNPRAARALKRPAKDAKQHAKALLARFLALRTLCTIPLRVLF